MSDWWVEFGDYRGGGGRVFGRLCVYALVNWSNWFVGAGVLRRGLVLTCGPLAIAFGVREKEGET